MPIDKILQSDWCCDYSCSGTSAICDCHQTLALHAQVWLCQTTNNYGSDQGRIQDSEKGGAQLCYCEHGNCVRSTQSGMQSIPNLGGSGGMPPPENFEKLNPLRLNLKAFLMVYCLYYSKIAYCTIIKIYLIK